MNNFFTNLLSQPLQKVLFLTTSFKVLHITRGAGCMTLWHKLWTALLCFMTVLRLQLVLEMHPGANHQKPSVQKCLHTQKLEKTTREKYMPFQWPLCQSLSLLPPVGWTTKNQHTEARLSFGFFLSNILGAVKEGVGERLLRFYTQ